MLNLPASKNINGFQKLFAILLMAGTIFGGVLLFNKYIAPHMIDFFTNVWKMALIGGPLVLIGLYVASNPLVVWGFFKTLSWKLTSFLIKMDPLSVMDRYADYLTKKLANLNKSIQVVRGKEEKLTRKIGSLEEQVTKNLRLGKAALATSNNSQASLYGTKVAGDKQSIQILLPLHQRAQRSLKFMTSLSENWTYGIEKLRYEIDRKRSEYEIIKEVARGLKSADDFINSDNEAVRLYGESVKALEESLTQKIGYIDEFERISKPLMDGIDIERKAANDEGLEELEKYMKNGDLLLPDFATGSIQNMPFEMVEEKPKKNKFLLHKVPVLLLIVLSNVTILRAQTAILPLYNPYASVGVNVSSGTFSYGAEMGIYAEKVWYALGTSFYQDSAGKNQWYGSFKFYRRFMHTGFIDNYFFTGVNVHIAKGRALSLEPGIVTVFNLNRNIAPQLSLTFPIYENQPVWKKLPMNLGVGLNWWIPR